MSDNLHYYIARNVQLLDIYYTINLNKLASSISIKYMLYISYRILDANSFKLMI